MTDRCSREKSLCELEFNDLNIHLYLTLNYGTASEHLDFDFIVLYNAFVLSWGLTITQNSIHTISDLDRSRLSETRSAENDRIGTDTDPEYRIDASLVFPLFFCCCFLNSPLFFFQGTHVKQYSCVMETESHHLLMLCLLLPLCTLLQRKRLPNP